jgi:hypothetical protein
MKRKPTRVLVTGFEPFAGSRVNPSAEVASRLAGTASPGVDLAIEVLPVVGVTAGKLLLAALGRIRPDAVVLLGEHGESPAIHLERLAVNLRDYRIADNAGRVVTDRPVVRGHLPLQRGDVRRPASPRDVVEAPTGSVRLHPRSVVARAGGRFAAAATVDGRGHHHPRHRRRNRLPGVK